MMFATLTANQKLAIFLLIGRMVTVAIMIFVIRKQFKVLHAKTYPELRALRWSLLVGSVIIMLANIVPIIIDAFGVVGRGSFGLLVGYVVSNNLTAIFTAFMLWYNLRLAERIKLNDTTNKRAAIRKEKA